ncbi:hypothetical protein SAY87_015084 [Trapa incisa]|uniref:Bifunctional inhibitor/plant lipid transfer protein/seed storage helical domain-containing protein n=1 Tax=Trapa incisa TaxID=236973 RepID=A0AAN7GPU2_9MYRT|nr:hypothetical protein SAY87_015084 [Trapa incisa]
MITQNGDIQAAKHGAISGVKEKQSVISWLHCLTVKWRQTIYNVALLGVIAYKPATTSPNPPPSTASCCSALSQANMRCLCSYKNSNILLYLGIDPNLAMQIPTKCNLPQLTSC